MTSGDGCETCRQCPHWRKVLFTKEHSNANPRHPEVLRRTSGWKVISGPRSFGVPQDDAVWFVPVRALAALLRSLQHSDPLHPRRALRRPGSTLAIPQSESMLAVLEHDERTRNAVLRARGHEHQR